MSKINTCCEGCIFAQTVADVQTGCSLERDVKLGVQDSESSFTLKRFCNAYRPSEWVNSLDLEEQLDLEKTVLEELHPRLGFFVRLQTDEPNAIDALDLTLRSITRLEGKAAAYVVVINDKVEYNEEIWTLFVKHFGEVNYDTKYHLMQHTEKADKIHHLVDQAFTHAQNGWIMCVSSGTNVHSETLLKLHKAINIDMKQLIVVEPENGFDNMIFPAYLFKFLNGNKNKIFQDEIVDGRGFLDKIKAADERSESSHIMQWGEFNAS